MSNDYKTSFRELCCISVAFVMMNWVLSLIKNATNIDSRQVFLHFSYCVREQIVGYFVQRSQGREASKGDQVHNT